VSQLARLAVGVVLLVLTLGMAARWLSSGGSALGAGSFVAGLRVLRAVGRTFFRAARRLVAALVFLSGRGRRRIRPLPGATRTPQLRR